LSIPAIVAIDIKYRNTLPGIRKFNITAIAVNNEETSIPT